MTAIRNACVFAVLFLNAVACGETGAADSSQARPNILLIVADDLGYADLGAYGSDIDTPNIDALAAAGMLLTQFHTAPSCAPTRAMMLTGNNNHVAGMAKQSQTGVRGHPLPGYENSLSDRVVPFPKLLRDAGYHTYMVGKWHLGMEAGNGPHAAGFTRSFSMLNGAGTHYDARGFAEGGSSYREDAELATYPEGEYSTALYTRLLLEYIDANKDDRKPFFAYAAYTSPHWPLQVPDEYLDLYAGKYDDGYDALRVRRFQSLKAAGIIPRESELPPRNDAIRPWEDLDAQERRIESRKMELYASMLDNLDDHVGELVNYLRKNDLYDNTLIIFMSDNGAAGEDFFERGPFVPYLQANFDNAYEKMGTSESFVSYDAEWAEAGSAPFQRRKTYTREGGIVAPLIVAGPGVAPSGAIDSTYVTVMDLAPTFLELGAAHYPTDGDFAPMLGASLNNFFAGRVDVVHDDEYVTALFHQGRAFLRQGNWKISTLEPPFDEANFALFDLASDPGEANDLAASNPEKLRELIQLWRSERARLGIILPEDL